MTGADTGFQKEKKGGGGGLGGQVTGIRYGNVVHTRARLINCSSVDIQQLDCTADALERPIVGV